MSTYKNLISLGVAAVLALGLAACSSSSDGPPLVEDPKPAALALTGVPMHGLMDADAKDHTIEAGGTATVGNVTFSCPSGGSDCTVTVTKGDDGTFTAMETGGVTVAYSAAYNKKVADDKKAADAVAKAKALGLQTAITAQATEAAPSVTATRAAGKAASVTLGTDGGTGTGAYTAATDAAAAITGWAGAKFTRGEATEYVTVYTNIDKPTPLAFTDDNMDGFHTDDNEIVVVPDGTATIVSASTDPKVQGLIVPSSLALPAKGAEQTFKPVGTATKLTFEGTLGGAAGSFSCSGAACSVTINAKGAVTSLGAVNWTFKADAGAKAKLQQPDADYLYFGTWMEEPDKANADGTYSYKFRTFAGGSESYLGTSASRSIDGVTGTATYSGAAAGSYVLTDTSRGQVTGATSGEFTATASLNAQFGNASQAGSISGTIGNFMDKDGTALAGWSVTLGTSLLDGLVQDDTNTSNDESMFSGATSGKIGGGDATGKWSGHFFGTYTAAVSQTPQSTPTGVAGRFDASAPGANLAGGFGASKK